MAYLYYNIHVAILIAVFYMFYRLLLSKDRLHQLNRFVLLGTAAASFVLPLCVVTIHRTEVLPVVQNAVASSAMTTASASTVIASQPWWQQVLPIAYWVGVIIVLTKIILSLSRVCILLSRCEKHRREDGTVIAVTDRDISPFSWMHWIVMSRSDYAHPDRAILLHEQEHIRRHHSWDVLMVDILTALQWFNPAMWMLRSDLCDVHEYEADVAVLSSGVDARQYQYLLVKKAMAAAGYSVANGINHSSLRQRIAMMNRHDPDNYCWIKAFYILPVVAISIIASARTVVDYKLAQPNPTVALKRSAATTHESTLSAQAQSKDEDTVLVEKAKALKDTTTESDFDSGTRLYDVSEKMPRFVGGPSALLSYLAANTRYPASAQKWNIRGRVVVGFVVNEDGSISDAQVVYNGANATSAGEDDEVEEKGVAEGRAAIEAEAVRVVSSMPQWIPGTEDGKAVKVRYHVPLSFNVE
jgi:multisubunit Na+/H+ antiporter MnhC subunit